MSGADPDADLTAMDPAALLSAARAMRASIRAHRAASGHDLCWHQPDLWAHLPEAATDPDRVPDWPVFLRGCIRYRASLDAQLPDVRRSQTDFAP